MFRVLGIYNFGISVRHNAQCDEILSEKQTKTKVPKYQGCYIPKEASTFSRGFKESGSDNFSSISNVEYLFC
jgi:hypothetical protein